MIQSLRNMFRSPQSPAEPAAAPSGAAVPAGMRVYVVGDIHGMIDHFAALIDAIEADDARLNRGEPRADTLVVLLGDLVDRGPDSAGVLTLAREWQLERRVRILLGNHEEMLLQSFDNEEVLRHFLRHGGRETLLSFGVPEDVYVEATYPQVQDLMRSTIPAAALDFIRSFEDVVRVGDYAFVHAGVRPGVPLGAQRASDLRWIRDPFLNHAERHEAVIVHGHTITDTVDLRANRIGLDTGAYLSGVLSALCLEGGTRRVIAARGLDGAMAIEHALLD